MKKIYTLLFALLMTGLGFGQVLTFDFNGLAGSELTASSNFNDPGITSSTISRGAGLNASGNGNRFNATGWTTSANIETAVSNNDFMEFTITPNSGFEFNITSIVVNIQRSGTGPREVILRSSLDGYIQNLGGSQTISDNTSVQVKTFTFTQTNNTSAVTYRFYMRAESGGGSGGFEGTGNDIVVNGSVDALSSCTAPTTTATAYNTTSLGTTTAEFTWNFGNGFNELIVIKEGSAVDAAPTNGTDYTANTTFGSGSEIGTGNYVVQSLAAANFVSVNGLNPSTTYHVAIYEYFPIDFCYQLTELAGNFTTNPVTTVDFIGVSATVAEGIGTYELEFTIANEDAAATSFDVVLTAGDNADINTYVTTSVTFPGGSAADETLTLTITDDALFEGDETLTFEIQNVTGGDSATVGTNNAFDLTITDNDPPPTIALPYTEDFSNCGTAQWIAFDEAGANSWACASGEYVMNGFPGTDDIDWLVSNFSIDFDLTSNENIEVITSERFGNAINEAGEFELRYSTDYLGYGDPTGATWTALTFDPNNTSTNSTPSADSTTVVDASSITGVAYLAFVYDVTIAGAEEWSLTDITIEEATLTTLVELTSTSATVAEGVGTYDLEFSILNEDATNATTLDVVLTVGDAADIDSYTTQTVTFPAATSGNQTLTITVTDDAIDEGDEILTFEIQNVGGGNAAAVDTNDTFNLTISASDAPAVAEGWQISSEDTAFVIDFENTVADVNLDAYLGTGFIASPASGQLDSDAWEVTGLSEAALTYGGTGTSGDYTGTSSGGTSGGGLYAFDTGSGNSTLGVQPTGSDFTPGTITLRAQNQTGSTVTAADLAYLLYVYNDQERANSFNFSYSTDDATYTDVVALDLTSTATADGSPTWVSNSKFTSVTGLSIAVGEYLYLRWSSDNVSGGGSVDQFALDNISVRFNPGPPETYTYSGSWAPSDPNGVAAVNDDIVIASGNAIINTTTLCNSVTVNAGAGLTVNTGVTLTTTSDLTLESSSTTYSSLILDGTVSGTINYERHVNINGSGTTGSNDLISAPLTGQAFNTFATANPNILSNTGNTLYLFGPFDKVLGDYVTYSNTETATLDAGVGYRAASDDNSTFTFTGTANNGTVTNAITNGGPTEPEWNLVGNPYPSYLNVQQFLNHDVDATASVVTNLQLFDAGTAAIYGYDGDAVNGWTIYNLATTTASTVIAPGQGFFVSADATNAPLFDLEFTPAMRSTGTSDDFISGRNGELIYFTLNASTASDSYSTDFYFNANASTGFDLGFDAELFATPPAFALYSHLVDDNEGEPIALQALNTTDLGNTTIALGVNASQGVQVTFTISVNELPVTTEVYLDDTVANTSTLLNTSDYVLTPATALSGTGRFFLRVEDDTLLSTTENNLETLNIFALNDSKEVIVNGQLLNDTMFNLYDIQGRLVLSTQLDNTLSQNRIDVSSLSGGVYVIGVQNNTHQISQKVIIK